MIKVAQTASIKYYLPVQIVFIVHLSISCCQHNNVAAIDCSPMYKVIYMY